MSEMNENKRKEKNRKTTQNTQYHALVVGGHDKLQSIVYGSTKVHML